MIPLDALTRQRFLETLWEHYALHARHDLPWRQAEADGSFDLYKILVSEIMLQQTQVTRVVPKYHAFLSAFPTVGDLAQAPMSAVLRAWQGLGYNRRAKFLWQAARSMSAQAVPPSSVEDLVALPGVGTNTAGAILAYAYNQPAVFIETNVRTVFLVHFFPDAENVSDNSIRDVLVQTLDRDNPREFYWAMMDYGAYLKAQGYHNRQSRHYSRQSHFEGSRRQLRGAVVRELSKRSHSLQELGQLCPDERLQVVLGDLQTEGLLVFQDGRYTLRQYDEPR